MKTATIQLRIDPELKEQFKKTTNITETLTRFIEYYNEFDEMGEDIFNIIEEEFGYLIKSHERKMQSDKIVQDFYDDLNAIFGI